MAWIEFHASDIVRLKKFDDFRKACRWSQLEALGFLGRFWGLVIEVRENGDISDWSSEYIASVIGLTDQVGMLAWDALGANGWLDKRANGKIVVHDWLDYAGLYLRGKYASSDRRKLLEIWAFHGRKYGNRKSVKKPIGNQLDSNRTLPYRTLPNQTVPNQNQKITHSAPAPFTQPKIEEIQEFIRSNRYDVDAEKFLAFYESNGWMVGRNRMKNWKAAIRTWHFNPKGGSNGNGNARIGATPVPGKYANISRS